MQQHAGLLQEQDDALDTLEGGIKRIKALGKVMEAELKEQAVILESLDEDIDKADSNMQSLQKKMGAMIEDAKSSDRALWGTIAFLTLLLGFLTMMVFS